MISSVAISSGSARKGPADQELLSGPVLAVLLVPLRWDLARAQELIAGLQDNLRRTSRNFARPPSGYGLTKLSAGPRSLRTNSGRRPWMPSAA
jgi:hypothetical protein